jgi:peptide deformylase
MLKIVINPDPILRQKAQLIPASDIKTQKIQDLIPEMIETMLKSDGVGLAAPQIGESIRLITVNHRKKNIVLVNPEITKKSLLKEWGEEGCLSVPTIYGQVKRYKKITVEYLDAQGQKQTLLAFGMLARIIQHEIDHLDGILFIDKAKSLFTMKPHEQAD